MENIAFAKKKYSWKRFFKRLFAVLVVVYITICIALYFLQDSLMFHPRPFSKGMNDSITAESGAEELNFKMTDGKFVRGWFVKNPTDSLKIPRPLIIYYPGNAEEVSHMIKKQKETPGWSLALMNYRGYGYSEGEPSEEKFFSDALEVFDMVRKRQDVDTGRIIVMGRSIGTGVATYVSLKRPVAATILVTPYDCMASLAQEQYPYVPVKALLKHQFNSVEMAPEISNPMLSLVASDDQIIPPAHAELLEKAWKGKVTKKIFKGAGHNNIMRQEGYWEEIGKFLDPIQQR